MRRQKHPLLKKGPSESPALPFACLLIFVIAQLILPASSLAETQSVPSPGESTSPAACPSAATPGATSLPANFALDLSASKPTLAADMAAPVTIQVGGTPGQNGVVQGGSLLTVNPGQLVTPAQMTVISQLLAGGQQTLVLGAQGNATGGAVTVLPGAISTLANLNLPANVALNSLGFTGLSPLVVSGATTIAGQLFALQPTAGTTSVLNFGNLTVAPGGLLSGALPPGSLLAGVFSSASLVLNVAGDVINHGTIASAGALSINAGGNIYNQSTAAMQALVSAQTVNLFSGGGSLVNSGLITATTNSLNITSRVTQDLVINNTGGTLQALAGVINLRDSSFAGKKNLFLSGGDIAANELNLYSGDGIVNAGVNDLLGTVNICAGEAHISAATPTLSLGTIALSGDPTFYNQNGNVTISGNLTYAGQNLAIVASGNIVTAAGAGTISTASAAGNGGNITMIAGASFLPAGQVQPTPPPNPPTGDTTTTLTVTSGSATGGKIDLATGTAITTLTSASTGGSGAGGNITMLAFSGSAAGSGTITMPSSLNVTSGGNNTGTNGKITMIAGAGAGTAIAAGLLNSSGGAAGTGDISVKVATPTASALTIRNGAITGGSYGAGALQGGSLTMGDGSNVSITARAATIDLEAGGNITTQAPGNINNASATGTGNANGGTITINAGGTVTTDYIVADAVGSGSGGTVNITGTTLLIGDSGGNNSVSANARTTGAGGKITINANSATALAIGAGSPCTSCTVDRLRANAAGNGAGGQIIVNNLGTGGISVPSNANDLQARAAGSGAGGLIELDASLASPGPLSLRAGTYDLSAGGGLGGTFNLKGSTFTVTGGGVAALVANGAATGDGGTISLVTTQATSDITVGNVAGNLSVSANGGNTNGNAGNIQIYAGRNLLVAPAQLTAGVAGTNGNGAILDLKGGSAGSGNLLISGSLTASGKGTGSGGIITLTSQSGSLFDITAGAVTNGVNGTITAAAGATAGSGGKVTVINYGAGGINLGAPANINVAASAGGGQGGSITLNATAGPVDGPLSIAAGTLSASAAALNSAGGTIALSGSIFSVGGGGNLTLGANATGTGAGGSVSVTTTGAAGSLTVGSGAGQFTVQAKGGSAASAAGNGGTVTLSAGQNLTVAGASLNAMPQGTNGNGPILNLTAGTAASGVLQMTGALAASSAGSGSGGTVTMTGATLGSSVNVAAAATISATGTGGNITVNTTAFTNNGGLTASNAGGGFINISSTTGLTYGGSGTAGLTGSGPGAITVSAAGSNTLSFTGSQTFNPGATGSVAFNATTAGAAISIAPNVSESISSGALLTISTPSLQFLGNNSLVSASGASAIAVDSGASGNNLSLQAPGGFSTAGITTAGGSIAIAPSGAGSLTFDKSGAAATTLNLNAGAGTVTTTTNGAGTTVSSLVTISSNSNLSMTASAAAITDNGAIQTTANKNITLISRTIDYRAGTVNAGTGTVTLAPDGNYAITAGSAAKGPGFDITAAELAATTAGTLLLGDRGRSGGITVTGNLDVSGAGPAGAYNLTFKNAGNYDATGRIITVGSKNLTIDVGGSAILGTISATTANISVSAGTLSIDTPLSTGSPGTITLQTCAGSNGNITLNAAVTGGATTTISSDGTGAITQSAGTVSAVNVNLSSLTGDIGTSASPILTAATGTLTAVTGGTGSVYLNQNSNVTLGNSSAGDGRFQLISTGNITIAGNLTASGANAFICLVSPTINVTGTVNAGAQGWVELVPNIIEGVTVGGAAAIPGYPYLVSSASLSKITAATLWLNVDQWSGAGGDIKFQGDPATPTLLDLSGSGVGAYMFWNNSGSIINSGNTIKLGAPLVDNKGKFMFNLAAGDINTGSIQGTNYVGLIASGSLIVDGNIDVRSVLPAVDGFVDFWGQTGLTVNGSVSGSPLRLASNYVRLTAGPIPWWNNFNSHPTLRILDGPAPGSRMSITAYGGDLQLRNTDDSTTNFGQQIAIGKNVNLEADWKDFSGPGNVQIFFTQGDSDPRPFALQTTGTNPYPAAITVNETTSVTKGGVTVGQVYFNDNTGISLAPGANNILLNAKGTKISLDARPVISGLTLAGSIVLDSNITITADPPDDILPPAATPDPARTVAFLPPELPDYFASSTIAPTDTTFMVTNTGDSGNQAETESNLKPVGSLSGSVPPSMALATIETGSAVVRHAGPVAMAIEAADTIALEEGEILIVASRPTKVNLRDCQLTLSSGATVLIAKDSSQIKIRNIFDEKSGSVRANLSDGHFIDVPVASEIILTQDSSTPATWRHPDSVARRHTRSALLSGGHRVTTAEVFYLSLIKHSHVLKELLSSSRPENRKLSARLLKTAAVVAIVGARHGQYSTAGKP